MEDEDRYKLTEYRSIISEMDGILKTNLDLNEIKDIQNELKTMPRPKLSQQRYMECEMRLREKWRDYLSATFPDEYNHHVPFRVSHDGITELSDTQELVNDEDSKMAQINVMEDTMKIASNVIYDEKENEEKEIVLNREDENGINVLDEKDNHSFIRQKQQHQRSNTSFLKAPTFLDNLNPLHPFWSMQYDSGNELSDDIEPEVSRNSNSSAVVHEEEHDVPFPVDV